MFRKKVRDGSESWMNVVFEVRGEGAEKRFLEGAEAKGMKGLKGHRCVFAMTSELVHMETDTVLVLVCPPRSVGGTCLCPLICPNLFMYSCTPFILQASASPCTTPSPTHKPTPLCNICANSSLKRHNLDSLPSLYIHEHALVPWRVGHSHSVSVHDARRTLPHT